MDREDAKNILQLCRPGHIEDRQDPLIAEALEQLNQDGELNTWFEQQQALDAEISAELNRVEPAAELKTSILLGIRPRLAQAEQLAGDVVNATNDIDHHIPFPCPTQCSDDRFQLRPWMSIAAIFVVVGIILIRPRSDEQGSQVSLHTPAPVALAEPAINHAGIPNIIQFLAKQISHLNTLQFDKRGDTIHDLQQHLASTGMPNPDRIPKELERLPTIGCVSFDYEGTKLSMICFRNGQVYHLITANKTSFPKECTPDSDVVKAAVFECQQHAFKVWSEGQQVFILSTQGTLNNIPERI